MKKQTFLNWTTSIKSDQKIFLYKSNQILHIHAKLDRSVKLVDGAHLRVVAPAGNTAPFEEMSYRWRSVGNIASGFIDRDLNFQPTVSETNALPFDQLDGFY